MSSIANYSLLPKRNQLLVTRAVQKPPTSTSSPEQLPIQPGDNNPHTWRSISGGLNLPSTISNLLHLSAAPQTLPVALDHDQTPPFSPKDEISSLRFAIHGPADWSPLLHPLHPSFRREIIKYGEFSQATYDAFDNNPVSEYHGSCLYGQNRLISLLGLSHHGYSITKYIYATSHLDFPRWLLRPLLRSKSHWCDESAWMGFIAVSGDQESRRIGFRDIAVAWRGTVSPSEWLEDFQTQLELLPGAGVDGARVEQGFLSLYTSRSQSSRFTKSSASEQVMRELLRLVEYYKQKGEEVSVTITGHSLGGALALLNAAEAASLLPSDLGITVISFGAPRVGNQAFGEMLKRKGVKVLRLVTKQDVVPKMPGVVFNEWMKKKGWEWVYTHAGDELVLDAGASPYLKRGMVDIAGFHGLETYLHLVDGYEQGERRFRAGARRDFALVNKATALLRDELRIPANWYQPENKGMVRNELGRWVLPRRDPEDIPSPFGAEKIGSFALAYE
ncbi:phospholipase A1-Igamma1, chloroplastic-like [Phalaenopsis equestris]|uniref:phospholipase A1-Igamma1, chloroplastic-like n=1 Tax=Phalaenopsis equestris TaxID=78828 RepID=UPI0009E38397|nr:phospholipase A1-Igamma1, chloroplastic-like [Phalaenopsis equestris]